MEKQVTRDITADSSNRDETSGTTSSTGAGAAKSKTSTKHSQASSKRRCVSTACIACRRRKSKCDGNLPKCAACASVYLTECEYAPHTDHRRKGVYKKEADNSKTKNTTLQTLIQALLNYEEDDAHDLLNQMRSSDNLEEVCQAIENREKGLDVEAADSPVYGKEATEVPHFEAQLSGKMGDLFIDGAVKFIGGTSNLIWLNDHEALSPASPSAQTKTLQSREEAILGWTKVTQDRDLILHFINMYFCWHYAYFTTLSKQLFYRDFLTGTTSQYCSPLLVNVMLALGCHFSSRPSARADPNDSSTTGDHFFAEAKRLLHDDDEFATPKLCTVQALALMSVREAGCGREGRGWVYSGMSFRMASDLGLDVNIDPNSQSTKLSDEEADARSITFWGCYFFDKCWSNYLGRQPQLLPTHTSMAKPDVFASEESEMWSPYTDSGIANSLSQPARTRAIALQSFKLAEISSDLLTAFYQPKNIDKVVNKQTELKKLTDIHTRLEAWKKELPAELEPKDQQLPPVLLMHMFYQLLYVHLYRPFLRYNKSTSPLPSHVSPRRYCTQAAAAISKLFRLYKRAHGLRQICNIAVYIAHSACTIHLLNLPDKNAKRDIVYGIKHLQEIGECWTCARRTLRVIGLCADQWEIELPEETQDILSRAKQNWETSDTTLPMQSPGVMLDIAEPLASPFSTEKGAFSDSVHDQFQLGQTPSASLVMTPSSATSRQTFDEISRKDMSQYSAPVQQNLPASKATPSQLRALADLTEAQQRAWNALQARMAGQQQVRPQPFVAPSNSNDAAVLFGGVDSLMEESQDWWMEDQSQLAHGFGNWNSPTTDWSQIPNTLDATAVPMSSSSIGSRTPGSSSTRHFSGDTLPSETYGSMPMNGQPLYNNYIPQQQQQRQHPVQHQQPPQSHQQSRHQAAVGNIAGIGMGASNIPAPSARKRMNTFEDDNLYYTG